MCNKLSNLPPLVLAELRKDAVTETITITGGSCLSVVSYGTMISSIYRLQTLVDLCSRLSTEPSLVLV